MDDSRSASPVSALRHSVVRTSRGYDAVALLTVYIILLIGIPSGITITGLGSLGRPSLLWGLVLLAWWLLSKLQTRSFDVAPVRQPVRFAYALLLVVALVSFAAAMLRGQPSDQISPAVIALVRLLSWGGVLLVALDGIRTMNDLARITRRLVIVVGLLAGLGIAQFATGQSLIDFFSSIPGLTGAEGDIGARGGVVRASGTALHALEYATALNATFPLIIAAAITSGFRAGRSRHKLLWWLPVVLIAVSGLVGVSRSSIIGLAIAAAAMVPALPSRYRALVAFGGAALVAVVVLAVPGLLGTTTSLFLGAGDDPSTASRIGGLDRAPEFLATSPFIGGGFGTFLPRYYIFDNQWIYIAIELGIVGAIALLAVVATAVWSATDGRKQSNQQDVRLLGYSFAWSMVVMAVLFTFFDALAFPISGGLFFLYAGLCGSVRTIGSTDATLIRAGPLTPEDD